MPNFITPIMYDANTESCKQMQAEEWEVLESIYPECVANDAPNGLIKLEVTVDLGAPHAVFVVNDGTIPEFSPEARTQSTETGIAVSSLPHILVQLALPPNYPSHAPPNIVSIRATYSWYNRLPELQKALLQMWNADEGVLYDWIEFIRTGAFLGQDSLDEPIQIYHPAPHLLTPLLKSHDASITSSQFAQTTYPCAICLSPHKGAACLQLSPCKHVFCRQCLHDCWGLAITEGDIARVACPDPACVKAGVEAGEEDVARVVGEGEVARWKWLKQKREVERDPRVIICPLAFCQAPVPPPPSVTDDEGGSNWARLRTCQACSYSFCSFCKRTWHGPLSNCHDDSTAALVATYHALFSSSSAEDKRELRALEQRYGKSTLQRLVAKFDEEQSNKAWFEASTMACPGCRVSVEKSAGCNHMTCAKCTQHFCYRCGSGIEAANPYKHFNTPGTACHGKLFDLIKDEDNEWQPIAGFDVL
ncbi:RWD-domain-containing protein [Athelia psychrophila]|uniref:RBR-type E3 ubiquitin transferase n=1 Tax=Athelia psychrophila TaxID=1759441 RepID=A0A166UZV6_9AGAM|nr:RWD-domain-containing protein [Fibularhizoctonia sp. CBS 109695]